MRRRIKEIWSPDLKPPATGLPPDINNFSVPILVSVLEEGRSESEEFGFYACREVYSKAAPRPSLWFDEFDWSAIRERVESLLRECEGCVSWADVIEQLAPHMRYDFD